MGKNMVVIGIVVIAVALGGGWYAAKQQHLKDQAMMEEKAMAEKIAMEQKEALEKAAMMKNEETAKQSAAMMKEERAAPAPVASDAMMQKDEAAMKTADGGYMPYDASKLSFAKTGKVVLFFRASWCPACRALDADIRANLSKIPKDVLILDVDYDTAAELKKQYGVTYQHTLVQVDASGNMIAKWSGSEGLSALLESVK